jgi:hypothetical protein
MFALKRIDSWTQVVKEVLSFDYLLQGVLKAMLFAWAFLLNEAIISLNSSNLHLFSPRVQYSIPLRNRIMRLFGE